MTPAILCSHTTENSYCYYSWSVHIQIQQILLIPSHILYIHSTQLPHALVLQFMNRLFITLQMFPWKTAVLQLSLNPSWKESFTLLSSHGFPLVYPAVSLSKLHGACCGQSSWPYTCPITKSTGWQNQQDACQMQWKAGQECWGKGSSSSQESRAPSQVINPLSSTAGKKWWMALPLLSPAWLVPPQYLHVGECSRAVHCLCLLKGRETDVAGQQLLYQSFRMKCLLTSHTC